MSSGSRMDRRRFLVTAGGGVASLGLAGCIGSPFGADASDAVESDVALADVASPEPEPEPEALAAPKGKKIDLAKLPRHIRHRRYAHETELAGWPFEPAAPSPEAECERDCTSYQHAHEYLMTTEGA